ncbi:MAG: hypothetical protein V1835_04105, partial [Candidatus Micrarchaeota archaeon]
SLIRPVVALLAILPLIHYGYVLVLAVKEVHKFDNIKAAKTAILGMITGIFLVVAILSFVHMKVQNIANG